MLSPSRSTLLFQPSPRTQIPRYKYFGCCARQSRSASSTSSSDLKFRTRKTSFTSQKRRKSLGAKCGKYGGWGNTSSLKSWICITLWRAVWCWFIVTLKTRAGRQQTRAFSANCWLRLSQKHLTIPFRNFVQFSGYILSVLCVSNLADIEETFFVNRFYSVLVRI